MLCSNAVTVLDANELLTELKFSLEKCSFIARTMGEYSLSFDEELSIPVDENCHLFASIGERQENLTIKVGIKDVSHIVPLAIGLKSDPPSLSLLYFTSFANGKCILSVLQFEMSMVGFLSVNKILEH